MRLIYNYFRPTGNIPTLLFTLYNWAVVAQCESGIMIINRVHGTTDKVLGYI